MLLSSNLPVSSTCTAAAKLLPKKEEWSDVLWFSFGAKGLVQQDRRCLASTPWSYQVTSTTWSVSGRSLFVFFLIHARPYPPTPTSSSPLSFFCSREVLIKQVAHAQGVAVTGNQRRALAPPAHGMAR